VGTYNILNPFHAVKWSTAEGLDELGADNWLTGRRQSILDNLGQASLDICALQELSARTYPEISQVRLNGQETKMSKLYTHFTLEPGGTHGVAVLYNNQRFELLRDVELRTPSAEYRCAACVDLRDRQSGRLYRVVSVHLKGYNPYETNLDEKRVSQRRGDHELANYLVDLLDDAEGLDGFFVMGDFNEDAQEMMTRGATSRQGQLMASGFNWSGAEEVTETRTGRQIDWIFYRDAQTPLQSNIHPQVISQEHNASDHVLIAVSVTR